MAIDIKYSGGPYVRVSFAATSRTEIANNLYTNLLSASWTVPTGATNVSGDHTLQSGLSSEGLRCRVRIYDPGSGNCARVKFQNADGTVLGPDMFLRPNIMNNPQLRLIASPFQFFCFYPFATNLNRSYVAGGIVWLGADLTNVITDCVWAQSDSNGDADATVRRSFRTVADARDTGNNWQYVNGAGWTGNTPGNQKLVFGQPYTNPAATSGLTFTQYGVKFLNGDAIKDPALLSFGANSGVTIGEIQGQLYDAVVVADEFPQVSLGEFDSHAWENITYDYFYNQVLTIPILATLYITYGGVP